MTIRNQVKSNPSLTEAKGSQRQVAGGNNCDEGSLRQRHGLNAQCRPRIREDGGPADIRRAVIAGTSPQHRTKSSICQMITERIFDNRVSKAVGITPGDPLASRHRRVIKPQGAIIVQEEVSRGHMRCRRNEAGVVADGLPVQRRIGTDSPHQRPERWPGRMARINESDQ